MRQEAISRVEMRPYLGESSQEEHGYAGTPCGEEHQLFERSNCSDPLCQAEQR